VTNHALHHVAAEANHRNVKKKIVGITIGATIFGFIISCVCIWIIKNPGQYKDIMQDPRQTTRERNVHIHINV